jgi:hypothetical protein
MGFLTFAMHFWFCILLSVVGGSCALHFRGFCLGISDFYMLCFNQINPPFPYRPAPLLINSITLYYPHTDMLHLNIHSLSSPPSLWFSDKTH